MTRQKGAVLSVLAQEQEFRSAQQLHDVLRAQGHTIGLTTVYRTLQALATSGQVDALRTDTEQLYRLCSTGHHHHLVCRVCSRTVEVQDQAIERWAHRVASEHGFTQVAHTVEVFGVCPGCAPGR